MRRTGARRQIPWRYLSKRFRRKLRRTPRDRRFLLWLKCKRPRVYARLTGLWWVRWMNALTNISPYETPFVALAPKVTASQVYEQWVTDELRGVDETQAAGD